VEKAAEIKNMDLQEILDLTCLNAERFFGI